MLDPSTCTIQGDLSRNDAIQLVTWCRGRDVYEFGMGVSTLLLARCARHLHSYETNADWYTLTQRRISQIKDKTCSPVLIHHDGAPPEDFPGCDVLFIDGREDLRANWVALADRCGVVMIHDSRRFSDWSWAMFAFSAHFLQIGKIHMHAGTSNMMIFEMRESPVVYENWNRTEKYNRVSPSHRNYVP